MNKLALIVPLSCLALAACGSSSDTPQTAEDMASEAKQLAKPTPGEYTSTSELMEFDVPGLPPKQADQMKQMFAGVGAQKQTYCLTKEEADKGFEEAVREMSKSDKDNNCAFEKFDVNGNKLDAKMTCKSKDGGKATMTMTGTVEPESQIMEMHVAQESAQIPGGKMNIGMKISSVRTGDCKAPAGS